MPQGVKDLLNLPVFQSYVHALQKRSKSQAVFELTVLFTQTTFKPRQRPTYALDTTCLVLSLYLLKTFGAYITVDRPGLARWCSPFWMSLLCATEGINCNTKNFLLHVLFVSISICGPTCREGLSENRAVETWSSLNDRSFCFYFEGLCSGMRSSSQGDNQGKLKPLPRQLRTKKKKE